MSGDAISALSMSVMNAMPGATQASAPAQAKAIDVAQFQAEFERAQHADQIAQTQQTAESNKVQAPSEGMQWLSEGLNNLSARAKGLSVEANAKVDAGGEMKPKDMLMLSVHAHEFLFHCELTSNVANRTSDGITQLFRQQS